MSLLAQGVGQAIPAIAQGVTGLVQGARGRKLAKNAVRPTQGVPQGFQEAVGVSRNAFFDPNMPGQQYFMDQIAGTQATGTRGAYQMGGSTAERIMGAALASGGAGASTAALGATAAQQQSQDAQMYMQMLSNLGDYQHQNWQYNQADPYAQTMEAAFRERDASNKNVYGALKGLGGAGVALAGGLGGAGAGGGVGTPMDFGTNLPAMDGLGAKGAGTFGYLAEKKADAAGVDYENIFPEKPASKPVTKQGAEMLKLIVGLSKRYK